MALGPHVAGGGARPKGPRRLRGQCGADAVAVTSIGNVLWCSYPVSSAVDRNADRFYREHVKPRREELRRGHRLDLFRGGPARITAKRVGTLTVITPIASRLH